MGYVPEVLTIGRSGVDIYPLEVGVRLEDVTTFGKFLGGSPTNVAVAAARMGRSAATITGVGDDPFGVFVRRQMRDLGVSDDFVIVDPNLNTPITLCEIFPPDDFPLYFYREPSAPDLQITVDDIPAEAVRRAKVMSISGTGLSVEPSRSAHHHALDLRNKAGFTIADLDYRPMFWGSEGEARKEISAVLEKVNVAVGNKEECRIAVNETDPDRAADALLERGVDIAIIKQGPLGTLAKTRELRVEVPVTAVETVNGLGAGDAFGGTLAHGLISGWGLGKVILYASTAGAIVSSRLECSTAMPTQAEVEALIAERPDVVPKVEANDG